MLLFVYIVWIKVSWSAFVCVFKCLEFFYKKKNKTKTVLFTSILILLVFPLKWRQCSYISEKYVSSLVETKRIFILLFELLLTCIYSEFVIYEGIFDIYLILLVTSCGESTGYVPRNAFPFSVHIVNYKAEGTLEINIVHLLN